MYYLKLPQIGTQKLSFYLATEEYAARYLEPDPIFFYWQVEPSVIIGRNQNIDKEVNLDYCREQRINVFRRKSGGGCVYADKSNVMLAYIAKGEDVQLTYSNYTTLVVSALKRMGFNVQATGRNDIVVDGGKVSGSAFYHLPGRNIVHGTLLYDTNMRNMVASITPSNEKLVAKGVESVRSRINLLKDYTTLTLDEIKDNLRTMLCCDTISLGDDDLERIREIEKSYVSESFIYGKSKAWNHVRRSRIENCGDVEVRLRIVQGKIEAAELAGDYFLLRDTDEELSKAMLGAELEESSLLSCFEKFPPEQCVRGLKTKDLIRLILS